MNLWTRSLFHAILSSLSAWVVRWIVSKPYLIITYVTCGFDKPCNTLGEKLQLTRAPLLYLIVRVCINSFSSAVVGEHSSTVNLGSSFVLSNPITHILHALFLFCIVSIFQNRGRKIVVLSAIFT